MVGAPTDSAHSRHMVRTCATAALAAMAMSSIALHDDRYSLAGRLPHNTRLVLPPGGDTLPRQIQPAQLTQPSYGGLASARGGRRTSRARRPLAQPHFRGARERAHVLVPAWLERQQRHAALRRRLHGANRVVLDGGMRGSESTQQRCSGRSVDCLKTGEGMEKCGPVRVFGLAS